MTISMNDKEVKIEAKEITAEGSIDNGLQATSPGEAFPITLSPNNENHFTFNDLVSNLEMYVKAKIKESDPMVTNRTIELVISDIETARQFLFLLNNQHNFATSPLSAAFFGKCTIPTIFLSDEYANSTRVSNAPIDATDTMVPFAHYMELRNERIPNSNNILQPHMAPSFFVVENTQNGFHRAKFIGFEEAFNKASVFSAHLDRTALRPTGPLKTGAMGSRYSSFGPLSTVGNNNPQLPADRGAWNLNEF